LDYDLNKNNYSKKIAINNPNLNLRNRNLFGNLKNYLSSAKKNLEKDDKVILLNFVFLDFLI